MTLHLEFKLANLWIGAFWRTAWFPVDTRDGHGMWVLDVWVCLLPCLPLHLTWERPWYRSEMIGVPF